MISTVFNLIPPNTNREILGAQKCAICLDVFTKEDMAKRQIVSHSRQWGEKTIPTLNCLHHKECLWRWVHAQNREPRCPLDRMIITEIDGKSVTGTTAKLTKIFRGMQFINPIEQLHIFMEELTTPYWQAQEFIQNFTSPENNIDLTLSRNTSQIKLETLLLAALLLSFLYIQTSQESL